MVAIGILFSILVGLGLSSPFWPYFLAHYNLFFTFIKEGEAKLVVMGQSYVKTLLSLTGHKVDPNGDIVSTTEKAGILARWFGVYWIGIPPFRRIYQYSLRWMTFQPNADGTKEPVLSSSILNSTFVKDKVYYGMAEAVETKEGLPLDIDFLVTLRVVNPYKAVFLISNWVEAVIDRTIQQCRVYVGDKTYTDLTQKETADHDKGFSGHMQTALEDFIRKHYGVEFVSCDILSIEPPSSMRATTLEAYTADQKALATRTKADADAHVITTLGNAEAGVITAKGEAEAGSLEKRIEAFKKSPAAAKALLNAEVGKSQGLESLATAIGKGLGWNTKEKKS